MADRQNAPEAEFVETSWDRNRAPGDEASSSGTSGGARGISGDWALFAAIAAIAFASGIVNALSGAQDAAWRGDGYDIGRRIFWEMTSILVILVLVPGLILSVRRMRRTTNLAATIGIGAAALLGFSALHIAGMVGLRKSVLWLAGSAYDFHFSMASVLYEFRKDAVTALLIGATLWLIDSRRELRKAVREAQARPLAPQEQPSPDLIWLRDGSSRIRVAPRDILWVASAGNYIEYSLADGTQHLIRGTLAATESELARFTIARIHRTRLANLDRVSAVDFKPSGDFELTFDNGKTLVGSRRYRSAVASLGSRGAPAEIGAGSGNPAKPL
ncbi:LytTR family transcriptional regulator DNA-binding domain-containing protein [Bradyrhizobium japonicum]|nr:LytTR family transcriptional regulator DNA-binding domain-containing protein [Bradyrhizobium japonicum]